MRLLCHRCPGSRSFAYTCRCQGERLPWISPQGRSYSIPDYPMLLEWVWPLSVAAPPAQAGTTWKTEKSNSQETKKKPALCPSGASGVWLSQKRGKTGTAPHQKQTPGKCISSIKAAVFWQMPRQQRLLLEILL